MSEDTPRVKMLKKVAAFSDEDLQTIWKALEKARPGELYEEGITIGDWLEEVYSEMFRRGLKTT